MKVIGLIASIGCAFFVGVSTAQAQILVNLESPPSEQHVVGLTLVRGYAFVEGDESVDVTVRPVIDGIIQDIRIPCCTPRQDVEEMFGEGTPLNSGFAALLNYSELSAGPHTIGVHVSADGEETVVVNHSVVVIRPGNSNFVNTFDLTGATCSVDENELVVTGAQVDGIATDLRAQYATDTQSLVITGASGVPQPTAFMANLTSNQEVPRVDTDSEGSATVTLNADNTLTYAITTISLEEATAAHIHLAPAGQNGDILFTLTGGPTSWAGTTEVLSAEQVDALFAGNLYINVHTLANPNGEIRGQIVAAPPLN